MAELLELLMGKTLKDWTDVLLVRKVNSLVIYGDLYMKIFQMAFCQVTYGSVPTITNYKLKSEDTLETLHLIFEVLGENRQNLL